MGAPSPKRSSSKRPTARRSSPQHPAPKVPKPGKPPTTALASLAPGHGHKWFGVPRWLFLPVVLGLAVFALVYGPWSQPSAQVRTIVAGLRSSSVYEEPGAPNLVNAARARQVIGNRPIVMAILDRTPASENGDNARYDLCEQIADQLPTDYVWVYASDDKGNYDGDDCYGSKFPTPTKPGVDMDSFDVAVSFGSELSAQYRTSATNLTPEIEEFVLSFDTEATADYGAVPTRSAVPDELAGDQVVLACAGMVLGTVTLFVVLRLLALTLRRRGAVSATRRRRHTELTTRLNEIADAVINPRTPTDAGDAQRQADAAQEYVVALDRLEHARTDDDLTAADADITALAGKVNA